MNPIKEMIVEGRLDEAETLLLQQLEANPTDDNAHYLLGNIARKRSDWRKAIFHYLSATEINPESPAREAHRMVMQILEFSNPDIYNP